MYLIPSLSSLDPTVIAIITPLHTLLILLFFLSQHHTHWQTPILVKSNSLYSLCPWLNSWRWLEENTESCYSSQYGNTTIFLSQFILPLSKTTFTPSALQLPTCLSSKSLWYFSSHFINKIEVSRIDFPHLFYHQNLQNYLHLYGYSTFSPVTVDELSALATMADTSLDAILLFKDFVFRVLFTSVPSVVVSLLYYSQQPTNMLYYISYLIKQTNQRSLNKTKWNQKAWPCMPLQLLSYFSALLFDEGARTGCLSSFSIFPLHISYQLISIRTLFSIEILFFRVINELRVAKPTGLISVVTFKFLVAFDRTDHYCGNMSWNASSPGLLDTTLYSHTPECTVFSTGSCWLSAFHSQSSKIFSIWTLHDDCI